MREAARAGLIKDVSQPWEFRQQMLEARELGWVLWTPAVHDRWGDDLMNARDFKLTDLGRQRAREMKAFPRFLLVSNELEQLLTEHHWDSVVAELAEAERQFLDGHWDGAIARAYASVESGIKYRLEETGASYGTGSALKRLSATAVRAGVIPANYQALFDYLDSIRSPRWHGQGSKPIEVEVGPAEALLMLNHARSVLLYLLHRAQS